MTTSVTRKILISGYEDWTGLCELVWSVQQGEPGIGEKKAVAIARNALQEMLREARLFLCTFDEDTNDEERLTLPEALEAIEPGQNWAPPTSEKRQFRFANTQKGDEALRKIKMESSL